MLRRLESARRILWARRECSASISTVRKRVKRRIKSNFHVTPANEVRSPRCNGIACRWPNPCPCFPMPSYADASLVQSRHDNTASLLSSASKERMYQLHKQDPELNSVDKLAADFRIRKQRVMAILCLKEMEKEEEARRGAPLDDKYEKLFESLHSTYNKAMRGEKHYTENEVEPEDLNGKTLEKRLEEVSAVEENYMVDDFQHRLEYNKKFISGEIKHLFEPKRPAAGWSYNIEILDEKRGVSGGFVFVSEPDGTCRTLNELERMRLRRNRIVPRRKPKLILRPGCIGFLNAVDIPLSAKQKMEHLMLGKLQGPEKAKKFRLWHAMEDRPPGRVYVHPMMDRTAGRRVKLVPTVKAFRSRAVDRPMDQQAPQPEV